MNAQERARLKQLVSDAVRERTAFNPRDCCSECGGEFDNVTDGCYRCRDRHRNRVRKVAA